MSNFEYVKGVWPEVAKLGGEAEEHLKIQTEGTARLAAISLGSLCEHLSLVILKRESLSYARVSNQDDRLRELKRKKLLPENIFEMFDSIREGRNAAVYHGRPGVKPINNWRAMDMLHSAHLVTEWTYRKYINSAYTGMPFEEPKADNKGITLKANKHANLTNNSKDGLNRNNQKLLEKTEKPSTTHYNQKIWVVQCLNPNCGLTYGSNGCDFHIRKCPNCQNGQPGEPID